MQNEELEIFESQINEFKNIAANACTNIKNLLEITHRTNDIHLQRLEEAVESIRPSVNELSKGPKVSWTITISLAIVLCIIIITSLWAAFWYGGNGRELEYNMKAKELEQKGQELINDQLSKANEYGKWAVTPEGKLAYKFAQTGEMQRLAKCQGEGWIIQKRNGKNICFPQTATDGTVYGWNIP